MARYVPQRGDVVWLDFHPQSGHEQTGRRPGIVISPREYNRKTGLAIFCPITSRSKGYPFEVAVAADSPVSGVVLTDQLRDLDWRARNVKFIAR
jgi:mRNA interferase MazF